MLTEHNREHYESYFQNNADYYIGQIERHNKRGTYSFNAAAFFLGLFWMMYRKMYTHVILVIGIIYVEMRTEEMLLNANLISYETYELVDKFSMLAWAILWGFLSNRLYISKSHKVIERVLAENQNEEEINASLTRKGGTSWVATIALLLIFGFALYILIENEFV
jgi:hypothetical protein